MDSMQDFRLIISNLLQADNEKRKQAEERFKAIERPICAKLLFELPANTLIESEVRLMCLTLLKKLLADDWEKIWPIWGEQNQKIFCEQLLKLVAEESHSELKNRLCDIVAEVANAAIDSESGRQTWVGILQFLEICASSNNARLLETAFNILERESSLLGCDYMKYVPVLKHMFQNGMLYHSESSVKTAAVRAYVSFITENDDKEKLVKLLSDQVPAVIKVCENVAQDGTDDDVPLQCLEDLATQLPRTIKPYISTIFNLCCSIVANKNKESSFRYSALEVMVSMCESSPAFIRKRAASFIPPLLQICVGLMTELDDDVEKWLSNHIDDDDDEDSEPSYASGKSSLYRIANSLGGKAVLQPFLAIVPRHIHDSGNWKHRMAAIIGLATIGEGCKRAMEPLIADVVGSIIPFISDPSPRVRYAVCEALALLSDDFEPTLQKKCSNEVVDGLCTLLINLSCPKVVTRAASALINFSTDCPKRIMAKHLPKIMEKLEYVLEHTFKQLLERGASLVLEQVISTMASVADAAGNYFINFYDRPILNLKYIFENARSDKLKTLRGNAIECISLIGLAVGKEKFEKDGHEIMQVLVMEQQQFQELSVDDPLIGYMVNAWGRFCTIMGPSFAQYLPLVMPSILKVAAVLPESAVPETEGMQGDKSQDSESFDTDTMFGIRTAGMDEKANAFDLLTCFARELGTDFDQYVDDVASLVLVHLNFIFSPEVRTSAAEIFSFLFASAKNRGVEYLRRLWEAVLPAYKSAIETEFDRDVLPDQLEGIADCITQLGASILTAGDVEVIVDILKNQLNAISENHNRRENDDDGIDDDDDDDETEYSKDEAKEDGAILSCISDVLHSFFEMLHEGFLPYFDQLEPTFRPWLSRETYYAVRQNTLCIYCDLIENTKEHSYKYHTLFAESMIESLNDKFPEVRHTAAYGVGVMGLYGGRSYAQLCARALLSLANMISDMQARCTAKGSLAIENAISAAAKILKFNSSMVDINSVIPTFMQWLPVWEDTEESSYTYDYVADLIESNNPCVLGENNSKLPQILLVIIEAFRKNAFDPDETDEKAVQERLHNAKSRLANIVRSMQANAQMFQAVVASAALNEEQVSVLQHLVS